MSQLLMKPRTGRFVEAAFYLNEPRERQTAGSTTLTSSDAIVFAPLTQDPCTSSSIPIRA